MDAAPLIADLAAEHAALDDVVERIATIDWCAPTPAQGWDVRDSISHLCYFDESAASALREPDRFGAHRDRLLGAAAFAEDVALGRSMEPPALLARWRASREHLLRALGAADPGRRVPWYGPAMSLASFATARLMETWAHGQDVVDAVGGEPVVSTRLRHVVHIGVGARGYAFAVHGVDDPGDAVAVVATAPDGQTWTWGDPAAPDRVEGAALDLALVLTQRRHRADTAVSIVGPTAALWMSLAQAFAGPAGAGRAPGLRRLRQA